MQLYKCRKSYCAQENSYVDNKPKSTMSKLKLTAVLSLIKVIIKRESLSAVLQMVIAVKCSPAVE
jgi:hypothetical protein